MALLEGYLGWNCKNIVFFTRQVDSDLLYYLVHLVFFLLWCTSNLFHPPIKYSYQLRVFYAVIWSTKVFYWDIYSIGDYSSFSPLPRIIQNQDYFLGFFLSMIDSGLGWVNPSWIHFTISSPSQKRRVRFSFPRGKGFIFLYLLETLLEGFVAFVL